MNKYSKKLFFVLFGSMLLFGYIENIKGVSYPLIKAEFGITYEQQGVMVSCLSLSYVLFCLVGGILLGTLGAKKTFTTCFVFIIAGLAGVFFMPGFLSVAGALLIILAGFGLLEVGVNALAAQIFTSRTALLMSLLHFFYGAGSSLSPRAAGAMAASLGWRMVYLLSIPLALFFFISTFFVRFPGKENESPGRTGGAEVESKIPGDTAAAKKISFFAALKTPMVWVFSVALGFMLVVELCSANWAGLYFQDVYHMDPKTSGAAFISNFYILFTVSRLLGGFAIEKIGYLRSLFIAAFAALFIFSLGFILGENGVYILPSLGIFAALFWPTTMALAIYYFRKDAPIMISAILVISGSMNAGMQFLIGLINRLVGPAWGYWSCLLSTVFVISALVFLAHNMRHTYEAVETPK
jgi:fucose permease